jgi:hypothetical protein
VPGDERTFRPYLLDDERLKTALWPDERAPQASFNTTVTRARSRLGTAADGSHHLPHVIASGGVYRVGPRVTTNAALLERSLLAARAAAPETAMRLLRSGLEMVRGLPFAGSRQRLTISPSLLLRPGILTSPSGLPAKDAWAHPATRSSTGTGWLPVISPAIPPVSKV